MLKPRDTFKEVSSKKGIIVIVDITDDIVLYWYSCSNEIHDASVKILQECIDCKGFIPLPKYVQKLMEIRENDRH